MLNNDFSSFMKYLCQFHSDGIEYMFFNCINYIYICANFIPMELNEFLIFDQIRIRSTLHLFEMI
jgi:hypothetical protein